MSIDYTKLLAQIVPKTDGEDVVRMRRGVIDALNSDGTVDVNVSGLVVPDVPRYRHVNSLAVGDNVWLDTYRGQMIVAGVTDTRDVDAAYPVRPIGLRCTSDLELSSTPTTLSGTSQTFTTYYANATAHIVATADIDVNAFTTSNVVIGELIVDTVAQSPQIILQITSVNQRGTFTQNYNVTLASAGSHTVLMRGSKSSGSNVIEMNATHSGWSGLLIDKA